MKNLIFILLFAFQGMCNAQDSKGDISINTWGWGNIFYDGNVALSNGIPSVKLDVEMPSFLDLWNKYVDECEKIIQDTFTETGVVNYRIQEINGDIKLIPKDTVWDVVECPEYKVDIGNIATSGSIMSLNNWVSYNNTTAGNYIIKESIKNEFTTDISRLKVCNCKAKKPYFDVFWEWLRENGYRK